MFKASDDYIDVFQVENYYDVNKFSEVETDQGWVFAQDLTTDNTLDTMKIKEISILTDDMLRIFVFNKVGDVL